MQQRQLPGAIVPGSYSTSCYKQTEQEAPWKQPLTSLGSNGFQKWPNILTKPRGPLELKEERKRERKKERHKVKKEEKREYIKNKKKRVYSGRDHKEQKLNKEHLACCCSGRQNDLSIQQRAAVPGSDSGSQRTARHTAGPGKQSGPATFSTS